MKDLTAALIIKNNKLLLVHNTKHSELRIEPPGGKRKESESLKTCAVREPEEELGIRIRILKLLGVYETKSPEGPFKVHLYLSSILEGEPRILEPEKMDRFGWYSLAEIRGFEKRGMLVPNLCSALSDLEPYLSS